MPSSNSYAEHASVCFEPMCQPRHLLLASACKRAYRVITIAVVLAVSLLTISCTKKVAVPDLSQQDLDQAEKTLAGMQLKVGNISGLPAGSSTQGAYVSSQSLTAGQQVPINSAVDLVAVPGVMVPDLTKSSVTDAVNTLQGLGLKVSLIKEPTNNIFSKGHVKLQTPPTSPTPVRRDSTVTLTVESPPNIGSLLGLITRDPSYEKLNPQYRSILDQFLKPPDANPGTGQNSRSIPPETSTSQTAPPSSTEQPSTSR